MELTVEADTDDSSKSATPSDYLLPCAEQESCSLVYGFSEDNEASGAEVEISFSDSGPQSSPRTESASVGSLYVDESGAAENSEYIIIYNADSEKREEVAVPSPSNDIIVPDEVAAEAIVRTSSPTDTAMHSLNIYKHSKGQGRTTIEKIIGTSNSSIQEEASMWSGLDLSQSTNSDDVNDVEVKTIITVYSDGSTSSSKLSHSSLDNDIKDISRREMAKMRKRKQRSDIEYRTTEREKTKERMKSKRSDPDYRAKEREKDRVRRKLARQNDKALRQRERERDREYYRRQKLFSASSKQQQTMYELPSVNNYIVPYSVYNDDLIVENQQKNCVVVKPR